MPTHELDSKIQPKQRNPKELFVLRAQKLSPLNRKIRCRQIHLISEHPFLSYTTAHENKTQAGGLNQGFVQAVTMKEQVVLRKQRLLHTKEHKRNRR